MKIIGLKIYCNYIFRRIIFILFIENGFVEFDEFVVMMWCWIYNFEVEGVDGVLMLLLIKLDK